jgi:hypothetical protein
VWIDETEARTCADRWTRQTSWDAAGWGIGGGGGNRPSHLLRRRWTVLDSPFSFHTPIDTPSADASVPREERRAKEPGGLAQHYLILFPRFSARTHLADGRSREELPSKGRLAVDDFETIRTLAVQDLGTSRS